MPNYVQVNEQGIVHTVYQIPVEMPGLTEVPSTDPWYLGSKLVGGAFRKLILQGGETTVNVATEIILQWVDMEGNIVPFEGAATVTCGDDTTEQVQMVEGVGHMEFTAAVAGRYILVAECDGARAEGKVIVA